VTERHGHNELDQPYGAISLTYLSKKRVVSLSIVGPSKDLRWSAWPPAAEKTPGCSYYNRTPIQ